MKNSYDKPNATLSEAMKAGYKCSKTSDKPKWLTVLCEDLGYGYHLATMNTFPVEDCVIQRVIGGGYDVEIYGPIPNRSQFRSMAGDRGPLV